MKKILISVLIVLLIIMIFFAIFKGLSFSNFEVLSVKQIQKEDEKLSKSIAEVETLMQSTYPAMTNKLGEAISDLLSAKEEYQNLANISTENELQRANRDETYKQEYLWTKIGRHATAQGVALNYSIASSDLKEPDIKNLLFTVNGQYSAIIEFISNLEDDSELAFRIEEFKMLPGSDINNRQATFIVKNIRIKMEKITTDTKSITGESDIKETKETKETGETETKQTETKQTETLNTEQT